MKLVLAVLATLAMVFSADAAVAMPAITKNAAAGSFVSAWKGSVAGGDRAVQSQIAVGVPNGQVPSFTLAWDIDGYVNV